jgi:hypothetical protein
VALSTNDAIVAFPNDHWCGRITGGMVIFGLEHLVGLYKPLMSE